ncbi:MAG: type III pantothenate kinase [Armatimonadota bacterium]
MLLAIDQGNTRAKFGLFDDAGTLLRAWAAATEKEATALELRSSVFHAPDVPADVPIGLCSVVPELVPSWQQMAHDLGCPFTVITGQTPTPLTNAYETPETLGPDRLMSAVAAADAVGAPVIPISLGTATVVDAVSAQRAYLGGMIAPGIGLAAQALSNAASALWPAEWHQPEQAIGKSSEEAMTAGLFYLTVGGIQAMVRAVRHELDTDAPLALTGWWAQRVAPYLDHVKLVDEYLVLRGIALTLHSR